MADDRVPDAQGLDRPKTIDGQPVEGTWRSHQVPMSEVRKNAENRAILEAWMRSYRPEELFDERWRAGPGAGGAAAQELPADEREPGRERRRAAPRPRPARLPRLRRGRAAARRHDLRGGPRPRHVRPRRHGPQPPELPDVRARTRRPRTASARCWTSPTGPGWPRSSRATTTWPRTAG